MYPDLLLRTDMTPWHLLAAVESSSRLNVILLFGLVILGGTLGARLFQKLHIPQVVGCIVVGIVLGDVLKIITPDILDGLEPFAMFALGVIGFMIGSELRGDVFKKYGRQFFTILFAQGLGAFVLVAVAVGVTVWFLTRQVSISIAMGLVLGAIASATAPAATVNVLWEYKTRGPLTAAVLAIVALDDALALLLYRGAATGAKAVLGTVNRSVLMMIGKLFGEIAGAVFLGFIAGVALYFLLKFVRADDKILTFSISTLLLVVGVSMIPGIDPILPAMTFGITVANMAPRESRNTFSLVEKFSPPIYTSFFVLAGAHIEFGRLSVWLIVMIIVYILSRAAGKILGSWFGARLSKAPAVVRKYLGVCLLPQAGVAIGLAVLANQQFGSSMGRTIIMVVMSATFVAEIVGPILVKVGMKRAGEVGLNITEEDLIKGFTVADVMDTSPKVIAQDSPLEQILEVFGKTDSIYYPVVDSESNIVGEITIPGIKEMFANRDVAAWLLAVDVAEAVMDRTTPDKNLEDVFDYMKRYNLGHLAVVAADSAGKLAGVLDYSKAMRKISAEVLNRRKTADTMALATG